MNESKPAFRYALPDWTGRVYSVETGGESHPMPGEEVNIMLTKTRAPISLALMMKNMPRGHRLPVEFGGKKITITRE